jgi:hypothetical protein
MGITNVLWPITPDSVKSRQWQRHERTLRRRWGVEDATQRYVAEHGLTVAAGAFAGMRFPADAMEWDQSALIPMLRGSYERELHAYLGNPALFVDIGSAYGTYLVGMALRGAKSVGFEINRSRRKVSQRLAALNGVADGVFVGGRFQERNLYDLNLAGALMLCDIDGAEVDVFTPQLVRRLRDARVIVRFQGDGENPVREAFRGSHDCEIVPCQPRTWMEQGASRCSFAPVSAAPHPFADFAPPDVRIRSIRTPDQAWAVFAPR